MTQHYAICRMCHVGCSLKVEIEGGRVTKAYGDKDNPIYFGYSCIKGRQIPEAHASPHRLRRPLMRSAYGRYEETTTGHAMDALAARLKGVIEDYGPRAVASYSGTFGQIYTLSATSCHSFMEAIGSPLMFTNGSIDQPGKPIAMGLHGRWSAGAQSFASSDVCMLFGVNPLLSKWGGIPPYNPAKRLKDAKDNGLKLIVVDPRRTDTAAAADIHLQVRPGCDHVILAAMIRRVIESGLYDHDFVAEDTMGLDELRAMCAPFTPERAAEIAGIKAADLIKAAEMFARAKRGNVSAGTGSNMAPHGTLTEYLVLVLNSLCGRWLRAGEKLPNPYVFMPAPKARAQSLKRRPAYGFGEKLRVHDFTDTAAGLPSGALAEEILTPGDGQVQALLVNGGNPVENMPDQQRMIEAYKRLAVSSIVDIRMSASARLSDFVFGATMGLEQPAISLPSEGVYVYGLSFGLPEPFGQYQPQLIDPPEGSDLIAEWELYYGLAQRLGLTLRVRGQPLDMDVKPTSDDLLEIFAAGSRIALEDVKKYPGGHIFDDPNYLVAPKDEGWTERLDLASAPMMAELQDITTEITTGITGGFDHVEGFPFRLISCRMHEIYNSSGKDLSVLRKKRPVNPAFMNPDDLAALGAEDGDMVEIISPHATVKAVVSVDHSIRAGCVALSHGFGGIPEDGEDPAIVGTSSSRLVDNSKGFDRISGLPRMSSIPVRLARSVP